MGKLKIFLLLIIAAAVGMWARPWVEPWLTGGDADHAMPELGKIYGRAAMEESPLRNPVILIPGMMGSKLVESSSGRTVWGAFTGESINPSDDDDMRLIAFPISGEDDFDRFDDGVAATGVLDTLQIDISIISVTQQAYLNILRMLGVGGYRDEEMGLAGAVDYGDRHFTCFQFPYDWRRDNAENARRLHQFILQKKAYIEKRRRERFGIDTPVKFDIVAHSMGGLIARYYLRYGDQGPAEDKRAPELNWQGAAFVDRLIMIGTPNGGSAKSMVSIHEGFSFSVFLPSFPSGLVSTLPSIYQLLPHAEQASVVDTETDAVLDLFDAEVWDQRGWGMLNPDQDDVLQRLLPDVDDFDRRRTIAKAHVAKCLDRARSFHTALNIPAQPPTGTSIHLFAGDAIATVEQLRSDQKKRLLLQSKTAAGDGTVTRKSALGDQRTQQNWTPALKTPIWFRDVRFLFEDHFGLTRNAEFTDNALFLLLEDPTKKSNHAFLDKNAEEDNPSQN